MLWEPLSHTHMQGGFLDGFVELANDYPYMWALYAVAIALPFVLCACCCVRSKPSKPKKDEAAERKKTDAPSPDDPKAKEEDDEQSKSEEKKKDGDSQKKKKGEESKVESPVEEQAEVSFILTENFLLHRSINFMHYFPLTPVFAII